MQQAVLEHVLEQIYVLDPRELRQVQRVVQERLAPSSELQRRRAFYRSLQASGLVKQVKERPMAELANRQWIEAQGQPVSQTIIEERC